MPYIDTINETEAQGELAECYARAADPSGAVNNVLKAHSLSPPALTAHLDFYLQIMQGDSPLSRVEREIVAVVVSRTNRCAYCLTHHSRGLTRLLKNDQPGMPDALAQGDDSLLTDRQRAIAQHAEKISIDPAGVTNDDASLLRDIGLTDRAIHDLTNTAAYFAYVNRVVLALGVELEK